MSKSRRQKRDQGRSVADRFESALRMELNPLSELNRVAEKVGLGIEAVSPSDPRLVEQTAQRLAVWAAKIEALMDAEHPFGECCREGECQHGLILATVGVATKWLEIGRTDLAITLANMLDLGDPGDAWRLATASGLIRQLVLRGAAKTAQRP